MVFETALTIPRCVVVILVLVGIGGFLAYTSLEDINDSSGGINEATHPRDHIPPYPDETFHHIQWFVQVSDIHISRFYGKRRGPDFKSFCTDSIPVIMPKAVLVTGDLTDAKFADKQGSTQFEDEWKEYYDILKDSRVLEKTMWLDVRGNHDAFNVPSLTDPENYFRKYSSKGRTDGESYRHVISNSEGDKITFIAVDACPDPGPKRPFNFFGHIREKNMLKLKEWGTEAKGSNMTIWFGHYPTSTIGNPHPDIIELLSLGAVYLCGHLHTFGNFIPEMYARHKAGNLELELADWKDNRYFRLFAIDHDLFSFTDETLGSWPVVLVTNPKHGQFNMPRYEPTGRMLRSTHIRILAFSLDPIKTVLVKIDGKALGEANQAKGPLYTLPWQPQEYSTGIHQMEVTVQDVSGRSRQVELPFTLDNSEMTFKFISRFILMSNHGANARMLFIIAVCIAVLPLCILRQTSIRIDIPASNQLCGHIIKFTQTWLRRCYLVSCTDKVFYPMVFFNLYFALGPWFVGEILDGYTGVCFSYGLYVKGSFIPGTLTFGYGFLQIFIFHIPLTLYYGRCLDLAVSEHKQGKVSCRYPLFKWLYDHGIFVLLIIIQSYLAYFGFYLAYGGVAFLLCPVRTWSILFAIYIRYISLHHRSEQYGTSQFVIGINKDNQHSFLNSHISSD